MMMRTLARLYRVLAAVALLLIVADFAKMVGAKSGEDLILPLVLLALDGGLAWWYLRCLARYRDDDDDDDFGQLIPVWTVGR